MGVIDKTSKFMDLLDMDSSTAKDIYAKYSLFADSCFGSAGTGIIDNNKEVFEVLLSSNIVDYMLLMYSSGALRDELAKNSNLAQLFNPSSNGYITKITKGFESKGWNIPKESAINTITEALSMWGIQSTNDITGADVGDNNDYNGMDNIFDDGALDAELGGYTEEEEQPSSDTVEFEEDTDEELLEIATQQVGKELFSGTIDEQFDTAITDRDGEDSDEIPDLPEKPTKFNPNTVNAEKEEAKNKVILANKLDDPGIGNDVPDWAKDSTGDADGIDDLPGEVDSVITSIIQRIEGVMKSCFELDRPYGIISEQGLIKYHTDKDTKTLKIDSPRSQGGHSEMEMLYGILTSAAGVKLTQATDSRFVPNYTNITGNKTRAFNYYPGQMLKYALGFVEGERHRTWKVFEEKLRESLKKRLNEFYKKESKDGVSEYYLYREKFVEIYSNSMLVIAYNSSGLTIRTSLIGMSENIENLIKNKISKISIMSNSKVTVYPVKGYRDVVDIQIINDIDTVMGKPAWAYKALKVKLDNNEAPSLTDGLPIGKKINGEIVEFKLDPSSRFMIFVAAGSGSGKGVLTLSLAAAAMGSGIPLFYTDYKPDMAPIFWEMGDKLGVNPYSFDCNVKAHKNNPATGFVLGQSMPDSVKDTLGQFAGAFLYLRSLALMCAIADYRNTHGFNDKGIMFIFDEIQAMQRLIYNAVSKVQELYDANKPPADGKKANDGDPEVYEYCAKLLNWCSDVDAAIDKYTITTGRQGAVFTMFIGQNATAELWNGLKPKIKLGKSASEKMFMARLLKCGTVTKLMGKGTSSSQYGLGGANISQEEQTYITKYRYFAIYDGQDASKAEVEAFKPFLTLNYDDIFAKCWTNGIGNTYGYKNIKSTAKPNPSRQEVEQANAKYIQNMQEAFPGEEGYCNEYSVHPGVGLLGLASMYCKGELNTLKNSLGNSYEFVKRFFGETGLSQRYSSPEEYMYDMSIDSWIIQKQMCEYTGGDSDMDFEGVDSEDGTIDTGLSMEDDTRDSMGNSHINETTNVGGVNVPKEFEVQKIDDSQLPKEVILMRQRQEAERQRQTTGRQEAERVVPVNPVTNFNSDMNEVLENEDSESQHFDTEGAFNSSVYSETADVDTDYSEAAAAQPRFMPSSEDNIYQWGGKTGRVVYVTPDKTTKVLGLTKDNSVLITMPPYDTNEKFSKKLFSGLWGAQYEFKNRWKAILNGVADKKKSSMITRATIFEDAIVFNKKMVATINILGGEEDVRIEDIVNFDMTAKYFTNIREIILDSTIFERAQAELGDPINGLFRIFGQLNKLCVIEDGCGAPKVNVTRQQLIQNQVDDKAREAAERAEFKNQMEAVSAAKNPNLKTKSPGYQNRVWEASKKFQGQGWGAARDALMDKNPKLFRAAGLSLVSIGVLGVGIVAGVFGTIRNAFRQ